MRRRRTPSVDRPDSTGAAIEVLERGFLSDPNRWDRLGLTGLANSATYRQVGNFLPGATQFPSVARLIEGAPERLLRGTARGLCEAIDSPDGTSLSEAQVAALERGMFRSALAGWVVAYVILGADGWTPEPARWDDTVLMRAAEHHRITATSELGEVDFFCLEDLRGYAGYRWTVEPLGILADEAVRTDNYLKAILQSSAALNLGWAIATAQFKLDVAAARESTG